MNKTILYILFLLPVLGFLHNPVCGQVRAITIPNEAERNHLRLFFSYDESQRLTEKIEQKWVAIGAWSNHRRYTHAYEAESRRVTIVMQYWQNGRWNNATRDIELYDTEDNLISRTREIWDETDEWVPEQRDIFTYTNDNRLTESRSQRRSGNGTWYYSHRFTYSYDDNGYVIDETYHQWSRNRWNIIYQITNEYTETGLRTERITYDMRGRRFIRDKAYRYEYDGETNNMMLQTTRRWTGGSWEDVKEERYQYDDENRLLRIEYYDFSPGGIARLIALDSYIYDEAEGSAERIRERRQPDGTMRGEWRYIYLYDSRGYKISESYHVWQAGAWVEQYRTTSTYDIYGNKTVSLTQR